MNKKVKNTKVLSDGKIAKVGQIVVLTNNPTTGGNFGKTITKITSVNIKVKEDSWRPAEHYLPELVSCEAINNNYISTKGNSSIIVKTPSWYEKVAELRLATPEERKQYYANKFSSK